jgi:hypothetical protein
VTVALSVPGRYRLVPEADELDLQRLTVSLAYIVFSSLHGRYSEDLRASVSAPMEAWFDLIAIRCKDRTLGGCPSPGTLTSGHCVTNYCSLRR